MTAFTLPWYAIVGAQKAVDHDLGYAAAVLIGIIGTTGGRYIIDISCGLIPKQLVRGEFFVLTAGLTAVVYLVFSYPLGLDVIPATIVAFLFGFGFRLLSQFLGWEEFEPWQPLGLRAGEAIHEPVGCERCGGTGYRGRCGVFEILEPTLSGAAVFGARALPLHEHDVEHFAEMPRIFSAGQ